MSWIFKYAGEDFRVLQCPLHLDGRDFTQAASLTYNRWKGSPAFLNQTFISFSLPFLPREQVDCLLEVLLRSRNILGIQHFRSVRDMEATRCWLSELTHKLHPIHAEKYKKELIIKKVAGTPHRVVKYKELFAIVGRTLADPLKDNAWKNASPVKAVIGKEDWYLRCELQDVAKWIDRIYAFHTGQPIEASLERTPWWEGKDKTVLLLQGASK